jgi:hypothetical protein
MDNAGNFAVTWSGNGAGDDAGVFARLFGPAGAPLTGEVLLNTTTAGTQSFPAIDRDGDGEFIVAWSGNGAGDAAGVFARRVSAAGVPIAGEFRVNATTTATQQRPSVAFDPDGEYVVTWSGFGSSDTSGVYGREFWSDDYPKAGEFSVNTTTPLIQINTSVAATGDNEYAVTWSGPGDGDADGVFGRLFANVSPAVFTSGGSAAYVEDGAPSVIDWSLIVTDADSMIAGATARISGGYMPAEDSLVFNDQLGISGSWDAAAGVLTLRGQAPSWDYQAALASVAYVNASQNPSAGARTVVFTVNDGSLGSMSASASVTVTPVNDAPVAAGSAGSAAFTAGGAAVAVDAGVVLSDVDSPTLSSAVIEISGSFCAGEDSLVFSDQPGITGVWDAASGRLTLSGAASVAAYQAALRSVQYANSASDPSTASRTVTMVVMDSAGAASNVVSRGVDVAVAPPPPPPPPSPPPPPPPPPPAGEHPGHHRCDHGHAHPMGGHFHVQRAAHGCAPASRHGEWRIDFPRVTIRCGDAGRHGSRGDGPACRITVEVHQAPGRGAAGREQPGAGHASCGSQTRDDRHAGEDRHNDPHPDSRTAHAEMAARCAPEDRGVRGRGR